jgi:hypothetical protein
MPSLNLRLGRCFLSGAWIFVVLSGALSPAYAGDASVSDSVRSTLRRVFDCAVEDNIFFKNGQGVFAILSNVHEGKDVENFQNNLDTCLTKHSHADYGVPQMRFTSELMRGQIFRALYVSGYGSSKRKDLLLRFQSLTELPKSYAYYAIREFGTCVVSRDADNSRRVTSRPTAGLEEKQGYAGLAVAFSECVAPGNTVEFSKTIIEGAVSEALFMKSISSKHVEQAGKP